MPIQILSDHTIAQIAAGEVVERPASVVKELIDNALDAGASNVHISVRQGGKKLIRVSDDGSGIPEEEVELAFTRHATSKLRTIEDLSRIQTLGFRGEALSSIASVSQLEIITRFRESGSGSRLRVESSRVIEHQAAGAPAGTVVTVENLFYNTPARLKFLKKDATEKRQITALVTRYAMAHPEVRFILEQDGREAFRSSGSGELADVMVRVVGLENFRNMVFLEGVDQARDDRPTISVAGYTSLPEFDRADRSHISLFVNRRWIQDTSLTYGVVQAYQTVLPNGRYPVAVVMIEIAPPEVDVNVHPTKAEVRFRHPKAVFSVVQRAVREAIVSSRQPGQIASQASLRPDYGWGNVSFQSQRSLNMAVDETQRSRPNVRQEPDERNDPAAIPEGPQGPLKPRTLPVLRVVGQVGARYIVAEGPAGLYLVDQHAAHVRVLYEELVGLIEDSGEVATVEVSSETIELTRDEAGSVERWLDIFSRCGVLLEPFGPTTIIAREVPEILREQDAADLVTRLIRTLMAQPRGSEPKFIPLICEQMAAASAVKSGQVLNQEQMQGIIRKLERCQNPREDPQGRPTLIHLSGDQLAREFGY